MCKHITWLVAQGESEVRDCQSGQCAQAILSHTTARTWRHLHESSCKVCSSDTVRRVLAVRFGGEIVRRVLAIGPQGEE